MLESLPPSPVGQKLGDRARPESRILERWTSFVRGGDVEPQWERMCAVGAEDICHTWLWGHETLGCEGMFPRQAAQKSSQLLSAVVCSDKPPASAASAEKALSVTSGTTTQISKLWSRPSSASPGRRSLACPDCPQLTCRDIQ